LDIHDTRAKLGQYRESGTLGAGGDLGMLGTGDE
jgi:hypothetical protein